MLSANGWHECCPGVSPRQCRYNHARLQSTSSTLDWHLCYPVHLWASWVPYTSELSDTHTNIPSGVDMRHHLPCESIYSYRTAKTRATHALVVCRIVSGARYAFLPSTYTGWGGAGHLAFKLVRVRRAASSVASHIWRIKFSARG